MRDLNDLYYFAQVVEAGGFSAASRLLGIPKSRLSRRVAELEARLGVRLLQRTTRKLSLTDVGERYYRHCAAMLVEADAAEEAVAALSEAPRGRVRVSMPVAFAQTTLSRVLPDFMAAYPEVRLDMLLTSRRVDLLEEGVDVALRVRAEGDEDPSLVARRLAPVGAMLVAAPSLSAAQAVMRPEELAGLPILGAIEADRRVHWRLLGPDGAVRDVDFEPLLAADDFVLRKAAALRGLGVTMLPGFYCNDEIADGSLVRVLPEWSFESGTLQAVWPHRRGLLPAVRAFIDFLAEAFANDTV
jgi:DNA-binding transcriptional LysR family regulator